MELVKNQMIKKLLLLVFLFIGVSVSAQVIKFRTVAYSENRYDFNLQRWNGWSDWEKSNMLLTVDLQNDVIKVYSPTPQIYKVYESGESYYDSDGDLNMLFNFIDQDYDKGVVRLLQRRSGSSEIYIEFLNVRWCYRVLRL